MSNKTVFVIGAGASKEANLPTGYDLKSEIANLLDISFDIADRQERGDYLIVAALKELVRTPERQTGNINPYLHEGWHIRDAMPLAISVDNFIDSQRGNEEIAICGKMAIVRSILEAERNSILYFDKYVRNPGVDFNNFEQTWYLPFFRLLTENCEVKDLDKRFKSVVINIFNYDRCIEHFLFLALQKYYRINENEAAEVLANLNIYHPYGSVGSLPWQGNDNTMEFGAEPNAKQLLELTNKIKTFTEGTDPNSSDISEIKMHMGTAEKLVFIGFAFHKLNMKLIRPENIDVTPKCYATTFGISDNDKEIINGQISELYKRRIITKMASTECFKFFTEFRRSLSF